MIADPVQTPPRMVASITEIGFINANIVRPPSNPPAAAAVLAATYEPAASIDIRMCSKLFF